MKLHYKTHPWPHQVRCLKFVVKQRGGLVQCPMRWGKTWIAINWACSLYILEDVRKVLIITVTSGLGVWQDQIEQHCPMSYAVIDHHGELLSRNSEDSELTFMLVNYQNLYTRAYTQGREWVAVTNQTLRRFQADAIIADEIHHLGNPTAEQSKQAQALARPVRFRLGMTGTMFHRRPFYTFGQMKWYDDGATFGTSFTQFKAKIAIFKDPLTKHIVLRHKNLRWMMDCIKPVAYIERDVPKRPLVRNRLTFELEGKNLEAYLRMEEDRVLEVDGETLTADVILTKHLWLMMLTGGFIKLPSGKYVQVGDCKLRMAQDRLQEYMEQDVHKVVVGCRFKPEIPAVARIAKKIGFQVVLFHGGIPKGHERHRRTRFFQQTKEPCVFVAQIATGRESIQLDAADTILWYSLTESYVDFSQFGARIESYNEKRALMHDFLVGRGTRDELTLEAMDMKQDVAKYLLMRPERAEKLSARH